MMGGVGSRLGEMVEHIPKPLLPVGRSLPGGDGTASLCKPDGLPFFDYELRLLILAGFRKFLFCTGYLSSEIEDYFGSGEKYGVNITYQKDAKGDDGEQILLGTGGALRNAYEKLEEDFALVYADSFMDIDYREVVCRYFESKKDGKLSLMTILHNRGEFDSSNVRYAKGESILYDKENPSPDMAYIDYGVSMFARSVLDPYKAGDKFDLSVIQHELSVKGQLEGLVVTKRFYEIGRPEPYREFREYAGERFDKAHKAAFLDRDGVINEIVYNDDTELLDSPMKPEELKLIEGAAEAVRMLKEAGYLIFIITNQPAAAKGKTSLASLFDVNRKLKELIPEIDDVFMCPHHPKGDARSSEKNLIRTCSCRKPDTGLIKEAAQKYSIDTGVSFFAGDSYTDVLCGRAYGLKTVFIGDMKCDICHRLAFDKPDITAPTLIDAVRIFISGEDPDTADTAAKEGT